MQLHDQWPTWDPSSEVLLTQLQEELDDQPIDQVSAHSAQTTPTCISQVMDIAKYSSLQRLLAVTAYVLRFTQHPNNTVGHLTPSELTTDKLKWLQAIQHEVFPKEIANLQSQSRNCLPSVRQLRLFLDDHELLKCGERIHNAPLPSSHICYHLSTTSQTLSYSTHMLHNTTVVLMPP